MVRITTKIKKSTKITRGCVTVVRGLKFSELIYYAPFLYERKNFSSSILLFLFHFFAFFLQTPFKKVILFFGKGEIFKVWESLKKVDAPLVFLLQTKRKTGNFHKFFLSKKLFFLHEVNLSQAGLPTFIGYGFVWSRALQKATGETGSITSRTFLNI